MKMDSDEIDEIIAHLINDIFLTKSALPAVLPEENTASRGKIRITNELKFRK
jgi:regulatory protein